ncbi:ferredoxin [Acrocarpospora pleiomorpha]|uniref:Ferredoxin n=2 Tax=Acrocarpospora pleiomorpha TaxID=90975 RepID=A0A5M3XHK2_9ACTN|nr:ferredoxin [Acrocarpospora pleiomorpha]
MEAAGVRSLILRRTSGAPVPDWAAGAHIDVLLPDGTTRQYSLCGEPGTTDHYRIGVLRERDGRGGSRWLHDEVTVGDVLRIRGPRNHFRLESAPGYLFVAGGIGITPILAMIREAEQAGADWRLRYAGRSLGSMAFVDELTPYDGRVSIQPEDERGRPDVDALLATVAPDELVYVCGPTGLIDAVRNAAERAGLTRRVRYELFSAPVAGTGDETAEQGFDVELLNSGLVLRIPPDRSVLDVVLAAGVNVISDCQDGICGSCETEVVAGEPDHRDHVLTPDEQQAGTCMMICVSRSLGPRLVLRL